MNEDCATWRTIAWGASIAQGALFADFNSFGFARSVMISVKSSESGAPLRHVPLSGKALLLRALAGKGNGLGMGIEAATLRTAYSCPSSGT